MSLSPQTNTEFRAWLEGKSACAAAMKWLESRTAAEAWEQCERADWLLWWAAKAKVDRGKLVWCACQCARRALRFVPAGDRGPLQAIETAERWTRGEAVLEEVKASACAASAASYAASSAAYAAASAASDYDFASAAVASAAAYAASAAAYASAYAYAAASAAAYSASAADFAVAAAASSAAAAYVAAAGAAHTTDRPSEHRALCAIVRAHIKFGVD